MVGSGSFSQSIDNASLDIFWLGAKASKNLTILDADVLA
jgi:hypothetical protein